jgi:Icc-related predicted phosphoesterase
MGVFDLPRLGMDLFEKYSYIPKDVDILVSHGPPFGYGDRPYNRTKHVGSELLLERLEHISPKVHIFGHVHAGGGFRKEDNGCIFANVAYCKPVNREATIIDI